jgi:hypothetical protein
MFTAPSMRIPNTTKTYTGPKLSFLGYSVSELFLLMDFNTVNQKLGQVVDLVDFSQLQQTVKASKLFNSV